MIVDVSFNTDLILPPLFYARDTVEVAGDLIGTTLVRTLSDGTIMAGIITETEAYRGNDDPACHAFRGKTKRTAPMFGEVGRAYVYFIYGNHFCFNIVAKSSLQTAGAVLIRAVKPIAGIDYMKVWRGIAAEKNIANGPGKLTQALQISAVHNGIDCTRQGSLYVIQAKQSYPIETTPRIGISQAQDRLWRFIAKEE